MLLVSVAGWMLSGTAGAQSPTGDIAFDTEDLDFILAQIKFAERHAAGEELLDILPNASIPWGLRTVDGRFNNLIPGQEGFGQADLEFPSGLDRIYPDAQDLTMAFFPDNEKVGDATSYKQGASPSTGVGEKTVQDSTPRLITHLIVDQSVDNPAAVFAAAQNEDSFPSAPDITGAPGFVIPNVAVDEGLSAPFNAFMTFFGQFFDHGLDLINKGGNGLVFTPLQTDDPLYDAGPDNIPGNADDGTMNFMLLTRATLDAGPDGIIDTPDDVSRPINADTPHVDQQQTYASHSSHQVLLRHYDMSSGTLQSTGRLLNGFGDDGVLDNADDGGMATWDTVQEQAALKLGIDLDDFDGANMPMFAADFYGNFIPGMARGLPQLVTPGGLVEGNVASPVDATEAIRINHSFFIDVAHSANPGSVHCDSGGLCPDPDSVLNARTDMISGQVTRGIRAPGPPGTYDDELIGVHFACGDGRCNENIVLTTIHHIFHSEHNRLTSVAKRVLLDAGDLATLNEWLDTPVGTFPDWSGLSFPVSDASQANQAATRMAVDALGLDWNGERVFQAARFGTEMQYNRIVFDEFAPTLAGLKDDFEAFHTDVDPSIVLEFAQSVYRFGHSMLTETVDRFDPNFGLIGGEPQLGLFEAFLNPLALYDFDDATGMSRLTPEVATGAVIRGVTRTRGNEIDEFVTGALHNNVYGLPLDLAAINLQRGRDTGVPPLNAARRMFYEATQDARLTPYAHWVDYADNMRHEPSLVNFIAAYGKHPTLAGPDLIIGNADDPVTTFGDRREAACAIVSALGGASFCTDHGFATVALVAPADALDFLFSTGAYASDPDGRTNTGVDDVDFWNGGLAEERMPFGGFLGSTHNFVFEKQIESLQNGDRFYYVGRTANIHFFSELESNSFTALAMRSTDLGEHGGGTLSFNIFSVPNHILEVHQDHQFDAAGDGTTADPVGDAELIDLVIRDAALVTTNIHVPDSTRFLQYTGGDHVTMGGTDGDDTIIGGIGDDTIVGGDGNDRIEGGDGADLISGGAGDDIITDLSGPDVIEGGAGNDAISSGNEEDVIFGDEGNDFIVNSSEFGEIFAGLGDDYVLDGVHNGHIRGGAGDDWLENLGGGEDLFQGDNGAAPEAGEPPIKGNDVAIGWGGNNDFDMENGDDIIVDGPGIERAEGQLGFDWISFEKDKFGVNVDLDLTIFLRPQLPPSNDLVQNRYDRVEGISGSPLADILHGTPNSPGADRGSELTEPNMALITGLSDLVPVSERRDLEPDVVSGDPQFGFTGGEIILGGGGSDLMVGEGGNDILDGNAALAVRISTPDPAIRMGPLGQALRTAQATARSTASQAAKDLAAADGFVAAGAAATAAREAADAALMAATTAQATADAAVTNALSITDALGALIGAATQGATVKAEWQTFVDSCRASLVDLGFVPAASTAASTAAEAAIAAMQAMEAETNSSQTRLEEIAATSAAAELAAQDALELAEAGLAAEDTMVLVERMENVMGAIFGGYINPGELSISRVISDEGLAPPSETTEGDTDIAAFSGDLADYTITDRPDGFIEVADDRGIDGRDLVRNVERLQFADQTIDPVTRVLPVAPANLVAMGQPTISGVFDPGETVTASMAGVTDANNISGDVTSPVDWTWHSEVEAGSFEPITRLEGIAGNGDPFTLHGESIVLTAEEAGRQIKVVGTFQDDDLVFETVTSAPSLVSGNIIVPGPALSIRAATFRVAQARLRVSGNASSSAAIVTLHLGTTTDGITCDNASIAPLPIDVDLEFLFDQPGFPGGDPGEVCVQSDDGAGGGPVIALSALTVVAVDPDVPGPVFAPAPADVTVAIAGTGTPVSNPEIDAFLNSVTAVDALGGVLSRCLAGAVLSCVSNDAPAVFDLGLTLVTFTATDGNGLTAIATATVDVTEQAGGGRITAGQLALYTFEEGTGNTVNDVSGVGEALNLTVSNPAAVTWLPGGGLSVNTATTIGSTTPTTKLVTGMQASSALTIEAWVVPANTTQFGPARIVALSQSGSAGGNFVMGQSTDHYETRLRTTATNQFGIPSLATPAGTAATLRRTHVVFTRDNAGTRRFYVNNVEVATDTSTGNFSTWGDFALALANEPSGDRAWLGELHLVALYGRALDAAEVTVNFEAGRGDPVTDGLVALYTFEEGTGTTVGDVSGVGPALDLTVSDATAVTWVPGGGLSIDASVTISSGGPATKVLDAMQNSQALSIEAWVEPDNLAQFGPARIAALGLSGSGGGNFVMGQSGDAYETRLRSTVTNQFGNNPSLASGAGSATLALTHVVYTRDNSGARVFYIDGVPVANDAVLGNFSNWGNFALTLANEPSGDRPWLGVLHQVSLYDRALDPADVSVNFSAGVVVTAP